MGFIVADGAADVPWIRAIMNRHESLKGKPDVGLGHWSPDEWRDLEDLHQQHHRQQQQQQQQEQQLRQQQYQQRQKMFRYRQQQQQQQQYHLQQLHETSRRWQHQQHYKQETARQTSEAQRVGARADREEAQAERGGAPPTSQTTSKPQSLSEYPAVLFASQQMCRKVLSSQDEQLKSMENRLLRKPVQKEIFEELVQEQQEPQQSLQAAQQRPCSPVEEVSEDDMGVLGKGLAVAGGQVVAGGGAGVEEQRPPFWDDGKFTAWWLVLDGRDVGDGKVVVGDGSLVMEFGAQDSPPLLQQQQKLLAPPPQEPWPPPMAVEHGGSGSGISGKGRLELERRVLFGDGLGDGVAGADDESFLGHDDDEEDTVDGRVWERVGIGTGARSRAFWGSEVALRRLTQRRRERVREK